MTNGGKELFKLLVDLDTIDVGEEGVVVIKNQALADALKAQKEARSGDICLTAGPPYVGIKCMDCRNQFP